MNQKIKGARYEKTTTFSFFIYEQTYGKLLVKRRVWATFSANKLWYKSEYFQTNSSRIAIPARRRLYGFAVQRRRHFDGAARTLYKRQLPQPLSGSGRQRPLAAQYSISERQTPTTTHTGCAHSLPRALAGSTLAKHKIGLWQRAIFYSLR